MAFFSAMVTSGMQSLDEVLPERVLAHYRRTRRNLPWRKTRDPYAIWVSEIMAQQTRVSTVIPYWERWMARFPTVLALAEAKLDDVLAVWSGLGYYSRGRNLHQAAREIVAKHGGQFPTVYSDIRALPGIGRYTAGAIASIAFNQKTALVDGNVARVYARVFGIADDVRLAATMKSLWQLADRLVPSKHPGDFNQGVMELGATVCLPKSPLCLTCPLAELCIARKTGRQVELPVRVRRGAVPELTIDAVLVLRGNRFLFGRRVARGLFGGLWELPAANVFAAAKIDPLILAAHTHKLTHRTIHYRVRRARLSGAPKPVLPYDEFRYLAPDDVKAFGVSSATTSLMRALEETLHV